MEFMRKYFDPNGAPEEEEDGGAITFGFGSGPGDVYVYSPKIVLAVNIALATKRPLLVSGEPGSGKTTLAINVARVLDWWLFRETVTSRTKATDLLWTFDTLRRLNDAQTPGRPLLDRQYYIQPGPLWWAFDPGSAARRGRKHAVDASQTADNPGVAATGHSAVVLIDEIDKADPDVPNDLLEPFDVRSFPVRETDDTITQVRDVLLVLTTNGERELPPAFLRRCVTLALEKPTDDWLVTIALRRLGLKEETPLLRAVAEEVMAWRETARKVGVRQPGTAEYLDALNACTELGITPASEAWRSVALAVLWKNDREPTVGR
jgi:MoxR-like ATPase